MSTTRNSFRHPDSQPKPTFRSTVSGRFTEFTAPVSTKGTSGYIQNSTLFDGAGWLPDRCMHGDRVRTEYRIRYNPRKSFHKLRTPTTDGRLTRPARVYDLARSFVY